MVAVLYRGSAIPFLGQAPSISSFFTGHDPARGLGQEVFKKNVGRVGSDPEILGTSRIESGRVGSGGFQVSRVGPGRPGPIRNCEKMVNRPVKSLGSIYVSQDVSYT